MAKRKCSLCLLEVDSENADILTMGAYGTPKYLCEDCAKLLDTITASDKYDEITAAIDTLSSKINAANIDDRFTVDTVSAILEKSAKRATEIKNGTYDFSLDEKADDEGMEDIPEELAETEEDRLLDEKDAAASKKFDKVMNWLWVAVLALVIGFIIYRFVV